MAWSYFSTAMSDCLYTVCSRVSTAASRAFLAEIGEAVAEEQTRMENVRAARPTRDTASALRVLVMCIASFGVRPERPSLLEVDPASPS